MKSFINKKLVIFILLVMFIAALTLFYKNHIYYTKYSLIYKTNDRTKGYSIYYTSNNLGYTRLINLFGQIYQYSYKDHAGEYPDTSMYGDYYYRQEIKKTNKFKLDTLEYIYFLDIPFSTKLHNQNLWVSYDVGNRIDSANYKRITDTCINGIRIKECLEICFPIQENNVLIHHKFIYDLKNGIIIYWEIYNKELNQTEIKLIPIKQERIPKSEFDEIYNKATFSDYRWF